MTGEPPGAGTGPLTTGLPLQIDVDAFRSRPISQGRPRGVLHTVEVWLPQTQAWLYATIEALRADRPQSIACETAKELDQFPVDPLYVNPMAWLRSARPFRRLSGLQRDAWTLHLRRLLRKARPAVLHSHFGPQGWRDLAARRRGLPGLHHVVSFYGYDATYLPRANPGWVDKYRELFASVDLVLAEGPAMRHQLLVLGAPPKKTQVHHLGILLDRLPYRPRKWTGGPLRIMMAGRFIEKKGFPDGIRAAGLLARSLPVELTIVGASDETPRSRLEEQRMQEAIRESGLGGRVRLVGLLPHEKLHRTAFDHHVLLAPSRTGRDGDAEGGSPVTITELAATGMPVVATTHCDIPYVLGPHHAPWLAPEGDVGALADRLRLVAEDPDAWDPILAADRKRIETEFDAHRQGLRLGALYDRLSANDQEGATIG